MTAVDLKALPWQLIDPSSIIFGPVMKQEKKINSFNRVKHFQFLL